MTDISASAPRLRTVSWDAFIESRETQAPDFAQAEDRLQRLVDSPQLRWSHTTDEITQATGIDCTDLLDEDRRRLAVNVDLGSK